MVSLFRRISEVETDHREGAATLLQVLKELFQAADEDMSGALDRVELSKLVQSYYQLMERTTLTKVKALAMTDEAIERFDEDSSGLIEFEEFVAMFCVNEPPFISKLPNIVCAELDHMIITGKVQEAEERIRRQQETFVARISAEEDALQGLARACVLSLETHAGNPTVKHCNRTAANPNPTALCSSALQPTPTPRRQAGVGDG